MWIGFSYLCENPTSGKIIYIYGARDFAIEINKIRKKGDFASLINEYRDYSEHDLLQKTFVASTPMNAFAESGFIPLKMISSFIWIRK